MAAEILTDYVKAVGVCCFTKDPNSSQMWAHYSGGHTGICLGFEFPESGPPGIITRKNIFEVRYQDDCPRFPISAFQKRPYPLFDLAIPLLTTKHTDWAVENEHRYLHTATNICVQYSTGSLKEIIFGARTTQAQRDRIRKECDQLELDLLFREAIVVPRTYELGIRDA
jgi:DUF2971 family protein